MFYLKHNCKFLKLGFGVYFVGDDLKIKLINFDIISSDLSQGAYSVVRGMRMLRKQDFFKQVEKKNYVVWFDTGKHFRNNEVLGYFLSELKEENIHGIGEIWSFFYL
jgi:hypothetical protein